MLDDGRIHLWDGPARMFRIRAMLYRLNVTLAGPITCRAPASLSGPRRMLSTLLRSKVRVHDCVTIHQSVSYLAYTGWDYYMYVVLHVTILLSYD